MGMFKCYFLLCHLALLILSCKCSDCVSESWILFAKHLKKNMKFCLDTEPHRNSRWDCLKNSSLLVFDEMMSSNIIPVTTRIRFIRHPLYSARHRENLVFEYNERFKKSTPSTWPYHILEKLMETMNTHVLQIDIMDKSNTRAPGTGKAWRHRRRNQMLPVMVFGITALGMVLVPIGFQFLAVLVGKALLLAKMALLLASVNGLKRVATSGVHYGLYHVPEYYNQVYADRGDMHHPRFVKL